MTVHAGENASADFVEDAILRLGARRIGHGLSLIEDPELVRRVREQRVCVELCPISNHQTSAFGKPGDPRERQYPLKEYLRTGLLVTISTDNPIISDTNIVREYFQASYACGGLSLWEALRIMRMGFVASFLSLHERRAMLEIADQHLFDLFSTGSVVRELQQIVELNVTLSRARPKHSRSAEGNGIARHPRDELIEPVVTVAVPRAVGED